MDLTGINILSFYNKYLKLNKITDDEYRAFCPFHSDTADPNLTVNIKKGVYHCFACNAEGNMVTFYKKYTGKSAHDFAIEFNIKSIEINKVDNYTEQLKKKPEILEYLKKERGYTETSIKQARLGWDGYRITIPIPDRFGIIVNIRRCTNNKEDEEKWGKTLSYKKGYGKNALYGIRDLLDNKKCIICAGEKDRIILKQYGFKVCTATTGEGSWNDEWNKDAIDKELYIIFDCHKAGKKAAERIANILVDNNKVKIIDLGLEDKEDSTDWFVKYKYTGKQLQALIDKTKWYEKKDPEYTTTILSSAGNSSFYNKNICFKSLVSGKRLSPYQVPYSIELQCDAKRTEKRCAFCSLKQDGYKKIIIDNKELILDFIDVSKNQIVHVLKDQIPLAKCEYYYIAKQLKRNIEELYLIPEVEFMDFEDRKTQYVTRRGFFLGDHLETNRTYTFYGTTLPDPKDQSVVHLLEKAVPSADNIEEFKLTNDIKKQLEKFRVGEGQTIQNKLDEIYTDLSDNVTKIYKRNDLLFAYDLVYHSVLGFKFLDDETQRGWLDLFVLGDAGQGKSKTIQRLIRHYKAGERITGENATRTGLTYNIQKTSEGVFTLRWSIIPLNDKRIVVIDQAEQISKDDYAQLTDMRSSGILIVDRTTGKQQTYARTRLIFVANPKRRLIEYSYGILGLKEIIGQNQDIRRFDLAVAVSDGDVPKNEMNKKHEDKVKHVYDGESCHNSIMFSWSRKVDDIIFSKDAEERILEVAKEFSALFSSAIPLVLGAEIRMKIARASVSLACILNSVDITGEKVVVKTDHVEYIRIYYLQAYSKPGLDYYAYSIARAKEGKLADEQYVKDLLKEDIQLIELLLDNVRFGKGELENIFSVGKDSGTVMKLFKTRVLKKRGTSFEKTNAFTTFLKKYKKQLENVRNEEVV